MKSFTNPTAHSEQSVAEGPSQPTQTLAHSMHTWLVGSSNSAERERERERERAAASEGGRNSHMVTTRTYMLNQLVIISFMDISMHNTVYTRTCIIVLYNTAQYMHINKRCMCMHYRAHYYLTRYTAEELVFITVLSVTAVSALCSP